MLLLLSCTWSHSVTARCTLLTIAITVHSNYSNFLHSCHTYFGRAATMLLTRTLSLDADQDSVRLLAVEACGPLARLLNKGESVQHVLPIVQKFAQVCCASNAVTLQASSALNPVSQLNFAVLQSCLLSLQATYTSSMTRIQPERQLCMTQQNRLLQEVHRFCAQWDPSNGTKFIKQTIKLVMVQVAITPAAVNNM